MSEFEEAGAATEIDADGEDVEEAEAEEEEAADPAPGTVGLADAAPVSDPVPIAPAAGAAEVAAANDAQSQKAASSIEVSRESIDGQLVAVRYEVAVPRSRLAELKAWQARRRLAGPAAAASRAAGEDALKATKHKMLDRKTLRLMNRETWADMGFEGITDITWFAVDGLS